MVVPHETRSFVKIYTGMGQPQISLDLSMRSKLSVKLNVKTIWDKNRCLLHNLCCVGYSLFYCSARKGWGTNFICSKPCSSKFDETSMVIQLIIIILVISIFTKLPRLVMHFGTKISPCQTKFILKLDIDIDYNERIQKFKYVSRYNLTECNVKF